MPGDGSSAASYATATDNLRTAARWLLTAAAAAGAVMVAGVQLTSIGSLGLGDWPRLIAASRRPGRRARGRWVHDLPGQPAAHRRMDYPGPAGS